jgi:D-threo-aldose 1-dehydrogenase
MLDPFERARVGRTDVHVTRLGLGGAHLAPREHPDGGTARPAIEESEGLIRAALDAGVRYVDTAPLYGLGESERRFARPLRGVPRGDIVVSTKVGRILDDSPRGWRFDFSRAAVRRSLESSLERLGLDRVDIVYIHDPDDHWEAAIGEAFPALADLRSQGMVRAIGAGMNQWEMELRFAREGDFDVFLLAGRYTLLEQESLPFVEHCAANGISVVVGGPYNSGVLADPLAAGATYNYRPAPSDVVQRALRLKEVCDRHSVPLQAAALQFALAHPAVAAVIPGAQSVAEVQENVAMAHAPIPRGLWNQLRSEGLISPGAPAPG